VLLKRIQNQNLSKMTSSTPSPVSLALADYWQEGNRRTTKCSRGQRRKGEYQSEAVLVEDNKRVNDGLDGIWERKRGVKNSVPE
jgi:hypothetical protein